MTIEELEQRIRVADSLGHSATCVELLRAYLRAGGHKPAYTFMYADNLYAIGNLDESESVLRAIDPGRVPAHYVYLRELSFGQIAESRGNLRAAEEHYRAAVKRRENLADPWVLYGSSLLRRGLLKDAEGVFHKATSAPGDLAEVELYLGHCARGLGRLQDSVQHYRRALGLGANGGEPANALRDVSEALRVREELKPGGSPSVKITGDTLRERALSAQASELHATCVELLRAYLGKVPSDTWFRHRYADHLLAIYRVEEAAAELQSVDLKEIDERRWYLVEMKRGEVNRALGRFGEAETHYSNAVTLRGDSTVTWVFYGAFLSGQGRINDAINVFRRGLCAHGDLDEVELNIGNCARALADYSEAIRHYEAALKIYPNYEDAAKNLMDVTAALRVRERLAVG